jgi:hypothetical protein
MLKYVPKSSTITYKKSQFLLYSISFHTILFYLYFLILYVPSSILFNTSGIKKIFRR